MPKKLSPPELSENAVKLINELVYTIEQVAEKHVCSHESIRRWKTAFQPVHNHVANSIGFTINTL